METFEEFKKEILERAHKALACKEQYSRAYISTSEKELCDVIKDNFFWCCNNKVIDVYLIEKYNDTFSRNGIKCNVSVNEGYLVASDNATVEAYDNAKVEAYGNAKVVAYGNAKVEAYGNAKVVAYDNAKVEAYGNAKVVAYDNAKVVAYDNAKVRAYENAKVVAYGNATVEAYNNAKVEAYGNVYIFCHSSIECKLNDNSIVRRFDTNTIQYASDKITFEKINN